MTFSFHQIAAALPEVFLAASILVLLMVGVFLPKERAASSVAGLSVVTLAITFIFMLVEQKTFTINFAFPYGKTEAGDPVGFFFRRITTYGRDSPPLRKAAVRLKKIFSRTAGYTHLRRLCTQAHAKARM